MEVEGGRAMEVPPCSFTAGSGDGNCLATCHDDSTRFLLSDSGRGTRHTMLLWPLILAPHAIGETWTDVVVGPPDDDTHRLWWKIPTRQLIPVELGGFFSSARLSLTQCPSRL